MTHSTQALLNMRYTRRSTIYITNLFIHSQHIYHNPLKDWTKWSPALCMQQIKMYKENNRPGAMVIKIQGSYWFSRNMMLLKTQYYKHCYNGRRLIQLQHQFPHITTDANETEITTGLQSAYSGKKIAKNQAKALSIKYCTNLTDALEEWGKVPAAKHIRNIQRRE